MYLQLSEPDAETFWIKTRTVRGSDNSPTEVLSEEKDKLVPENWRGREKKNIKGLYQNHIHNLIPCWKHLQSFKQIEGKL